MNYYIQGNKEKADQIKAAFENKGMSDLSGYNFGNKHALFYTYDCGGSKVLATVCANLHVADIIKTHTDYKELELPVEPKFKVGDWVAGIDDEGDMATEKIVSFSHNKVLLVDTDGCRTEYPKTELRNFHLWTIADAKDGDVLSTNSIICIFKKLDKDGYYIISPCIYTVKGGLEVIDDENDSIGSCGFKPATKEDRELLFRKMKEAGYEWDAKKKELRKTKPHYDITNFHAGMPVLVRWYNTGRWRYSLYSFYEEDSINPFDTVKGSFTQCIPFNNDTKHLLGTTDMCDEMYINW